MKKEIYIAGFPGSVGGANSELLANAALLRSRGVAVHLVAMYGPESIEPAMRAVTDRLGCKVHLYSRGIFSGKVVAAWNSMRFLCYLPEIVQDGRPRRSIYFNCMTDVTDLEAMNHAAGFIDVHGFVSQYQRSRLYPVLERGAPVRELEGYRPYFDAAAMGISFEYRPPDEEFVLGRISRDDPSKFSPDTWSLFDRVDTGRHRKRTVILGFGPRSAKSLGDPRTGTYELYAPGSLTPAAFYSRVHCIIHKTGGSRESYCRIVPEAAAAGVPMIVEKDFAFPELIVDGVTGFMCSTSTEMIARASELAHDETRRRRIIESARDYLGMELANSDKCYESWRTIL